MSPNFDFSLGLGLDLGSIGIFNQSLPANLLPPLHHPAMVDRENWFKDTLGSTTTQYLPSTSPPAVTMERSGTLNVRLSCDPSNSDQVRVKVIDPTSSFTGSGFKTETYTLDTFSSLVPSKSLNTSAKAVSDLLATSPHLSTEFYAPAPSEYSLSTLYTGEKKRTRDSVSSMRMGGWSSVN